MDTKLKLIEIARDQIQRKGYNGFSYADLATEMGICKASIHHHFPTKEDLGLAVAADYREYLRFALHEIDSANDNCFTKLESYIGIFRNSLENNNKVCLAIMLAAEQESLPESIKVETGKFFQDNDQWLTALLNAGHTQGKFKLTSTASETAKLIFSAIGGAMIVAESMQDLQRIESVGAWILTSIKKN